jgi:Sulfatase
MRDAKALAGVGIPAWPLLVVNALLLLVPKLVLIQFLDETLWGDVHARNIVPTLAQDILLALLMLVLTLVLLRKPGMARVLAAGFVSALLLLGLLIDMRVRQLWLKPLNLSMINYVLSNMSGLTSGFGLFFKAQASIHPPLTFERLCFYLLVLFASLWALIGWSVRRRPPAIEWRRTSVGFATLAFLVLGALAVSANQLRYRVNENPLVGPLIAGIKTPFVKRDVESEKLADLFELKPKPLNLQRETSRKILAEVSPFRNVVLIVYESMRWRDLNIFDERTTLAPTLARLAAEGIVSKCYVAVPHSSKAYYTVLTGRYPFPGIEMREVIKDKNDAIWHYLRDSRRTASYAVSSQYLGFESMGTLLRSLGIEPYETHELPNAKGVALQTGSSFGESDKSLYPLGSQFLSTVPAPFAAIFFPLAAHYPYYCADANWKRHGLADYRKCVAESDANLAGFLESLNRFDLLRDTLLVIVGDHGESFGEHGVYVHNSSMYDEEVSVPLVFWSQDGRLGHQFIPYSRQIDIVPTIADLMGSMDSPTAVQGLSLLRYPETPPPNFMATFFDDLAAALIEPPFKYIYDPSGSRLLAFNDVNDPLESSPLTLPDDRRQVIIKRIRSFLAYQRGAFPSN